jgi:heme/copper-type cytochrome/quinol oxidase subunit 2
MNLGFMLICTIVIIFLPLLGMGIYAKWREHQSEEYYKTHGHESA